MATAENFRPAAGRFNCCFVRFGGLLQPSPGMEVYLCEHIINYFTDMKKIGLIMMVSMACGMLPAQEADTVARRFSLEDCLEYALGNNYSLKSVQLTESRQDDAYEQSKMERLPSLNASMSESASRTDAASSWGGSYGLDASLTLYQGGSIAGAVEQNKLKREQAAWQTSQAANDLTIGILQAFLTVLGNEELLKYQQAVVAAGEEQVKQGSEQFRFGKILESDYMLLQAQYANDRNSVLNTEIARDNGLLSLKSQLSMPPDADLRIVYPDTAALRTMSLLPTVDDVLQQTVSSLPDLKISQYSLDIAAVDVKLSKAGYLPTLSLRGSVGTGHTDVAAFGSQLSDRANGQIGLTVSIPLYDNGRTRSKVRQSRIALLQAELAQKQTELEVRQTVISEYRDVVSAYNNYLTTDIRQNAYAKTFDVYRAQFNVGAITTVDLLQQQNNYISALNDYIRSKYEFMLKRKILDVYMGNNITM
jgi:outer membrane protein